MVQLETVPERPSNSHTCTKEALFGSKTTSRKACVAMNIWEMVGKAKNALSLSPVYALVLRQEQMTTIYLLAIIDDLSIKEVLY